MIKTCTKIQSNGAITQPSGMECYQTWINVGESARMTIEQIGPSLLRANSLTLDKRPAHRLKAIYPLYIRVRF